MCLRASRISPLKLRLSHTNTARALRTSPAGNVTRSWRVAQADHEAEVFGVVAVGDLQQAEVALAILAQAVRFGHNFQPRGFEAGLDAGQQLAVRDRHPRRGACGRCHGRDLFADHRPSAQRADTNSTSCIKGTPLVKSINLTIHVLQQE